MNDFKVHPARKAKLADAVFDQILAQLTSGQFSPGDKLPSEAELSMMFSVSRPVVRQALMRLTADGLVYSRQGMGTFVSAPADDGLVKLAGAADFSKLLLSYEPRLVIEQQCARLAALRRTRSDLDIMQRSVEELHDEIEKGERGFEQDVAFHEAIAKASRNEFFSQLLGDLRRPVTETMNLGLQLSRERLPARRMRVIEEHTNILNAIAAEDAEAAGGYMHHHILQARATVNEVLSAVSPPSE